MNPVHFPGSFQPSPNGRIVQNRRRHAAATDTTDPVAIHTVAEQYGRQVADGTIEFDVASSALSSICLWHPRIGVARFDVVNERVQRTLIKAAFSAELAAAQEIRLGLQPMLNRRAPSADLRAAAYRLSAARLMRPDCDAIVDQEIAKRLGGRSIAQ